MSRVLLILLSSSPAFLAASPQPQPFARSLVFEPNRGQALAKVRRHTLVIDPTVSFVSTFGFATSAHEAAVAVDSFGNSYVTPSNEQGRVPVTDHSKWLNRDCTRLSSHVLHDKLQDIRG